MNKSFYNVAIMMIEYLTQIVRQGIINNKQLYQDILMYKVCVYVICTHTVKLSLYAIATVFSLS